MSLDMNHRVNDPAAFWANVRTRAQADGHHWIARMASLLVAQLDSDTDELRRRVA